MLIGYVRYVPSGPDETDQIKTMAERSVSKICTEQTGSRAAELRARQDMLAFAREGDSVIVTGIRVIARSISEFLDVIQQLEDRKVTFIAINEDIDTSTENGQFLVKVLKSLSTLDADSIVSQNKEQAAKELAAKTLQDMQKAQAASHPQSKVLTPPAQTPAPAPAPATGKPPVQANAQPNEAAGREDRDDD